MIRQRAKRPGCEVYGSAAARRLGLDENVAATCLALECAIHDQAAVREVDVAPLEPSGLTEAEPGGCQQHPQCMQAGGDDPEQNDFPRGGWRAHSVMQRGWSQFSRLGPPRLTLS